LPSKKSRVLYNFIRNILFRLDAEKAHEVTLKLIGFIFCIPGIRILCSNYFRIKDPFTFLGLEFYNRVGLAAGFDKNAKHLKDLSALGFGHIEIGTVTPLPQSGNEKPRLFRLIKDESIINRMGFNNDGLVAIAKRLQNRPNDLIVGGNIGKNKITPNEKAVDDYIKCFAGLYNLVDYFVINISSPNTPNLRELQDKKPLQEILSKLVEIRKSFVSRGRKSIPILLKIAPDLNNFQLDDITETVIMCGIDGIVATNTTISRENLIEAKDRISEIGAGGLSGKVLSKKSDEILSYLKQKVGSSPIGFIGVGGVHNEKSALSKIDAGADIVQLYSSFIYGGPFVVKKIASTIKNLNS